MPNFEAGDFADMLNAFVLGAFADGPRSLSEIQERVERAERLLYWAAAKTGKKAVGSISDAVNRLTLDGSLKRETRDDVADAYSLTTYGQQQLERYRAQRDFLISEFLEHANLNESFRKFLNGSGSLWAN